MDTNTLIIDLLNQNNEFRLESMLKVTYKAKNLLHAPNLIKLGQKAQYQIANEAQEKTFFFSSFPFTTKIIIKN